jgi:hypothetical protein
VPAAPVGYDAWGGTRFGYMLGAGGFWYGAAAGVVRFGALEFEYDGAALGTVAA